MNSIISSVTSDLLSKAMDVCAETHRVIANNIANVDSQGFRARKVDFDSIFEGARQAVVDNNQKALSQQVNAIKPDQLPIHDSDDQVIGLDQSMVQLTENTLRFHALTDMRKGLGSLMKIAITGSNR